MCARGPSGPLLLCVEHRSPGVVFQMERCSVGEVFRLRIRKRPRMRSGAAHVRWVPACGWSVRAYWAASVVARLRSSSMTPAPSAPIASVRAWPSEAFWASMSAMLYGMTATVPVAPAPSTVIW